MMRRREFTMLLGIAAAWPMAAQAQQTGKVSRIGYLGTSSPSLERPLVDAFRQKLRDLGRVEGENIAIEYRWAQGRDDQLPSLALELVRLKPDVIVTTGTPGTLAAKQATSTIPIVFASSGNPVLGGLVASYARPGGNITGFTILGPDLEGKRLELLKDTVSGLSRVAVLWNPTNPGLTAGYYQQMRTSATALGVTVSVAAEIRRPDDLENAFAAIAKERPHALFVLADRLLLAHRTQIVNFAATSQLPGMYPYREYVDAGGLMSYAPSDIDQFRRTAVYVDRILKGTKPADLPVEEPTKFEFVINMKTAKALRLTIPNSLQLLADEVIE
jgi:putative tryptophan/tyrosine transport system substrate-binding protein